MQGSVGFGANIIAVPLLVLIDPAFVPAPALLGGFGINVAMMLRDRHAVSPRSVGGAMVGRIIGTVVGVAALTALNERSLSLVVAVVVLAAVAVTASGFTAPRSPTNLVLAGTMSGIGASTAGIGGPPVALLFKDAPGAEVRGSLGAFFVAGNVVSLGAMAAVGLLGWNELRLGLLLAPAAGAGFACTRWTIPIVDRGFVRPAILALSALAAVAVVARLVVV